MLDSRKSFRQVSLEVEETLSTEAVTGASEGAVAPSEAGLVNLEKRRTRSSWLCFSKDFDFYQHMVLIGHFGGFGNLTTVTVVERICQTGQN